mmetsp:Transcript_12669/g.30053  ORF Transcript_12669/g.30053 Transcript_12669/m.30053 type:complete len:233 (+) Transcript_12669:1225-1923(+)
MTVATLCSRHRAPPSGRTPQSPTGSTPTTAATPHRRRFGSPRPPRTCTCSTATHGRGCRKKTPRGFLWSGRISTASTEARSSPPDGSLRARVPSVQATRQPSASGMRPSDRGTARLPCRSTPSRASAARSTGSSRSPPSTSTRSARPFTTAMRRRRATGSAPTTTTAATSPTPRRCSTRRAASASSQRPSRKSTRRCTPGGLWRTTALPGGICLRSQATASTSTSTSTTSST